MNNQLLLTLALFFTIGTFAQTPGFNYQAVILNPDAQSLPGNDVEAGLLSESEIAIRFTIENNAGTEYQETHTTKTDAYGMVHLMVGQGNATMGSFMDVVWDGTAIYLQVEIDFTSSGSNYEALDRQVLSYIPQPLSSEDANRINELELAINTVASDLATIELTPGPQGEQGPQGPIGLTGVTGPQGITGNDGVDGAVGPQGSQGPTGNDGAQGPIGLTGATGLQGIQGLPGNNGADGQDGVDGTFPDGTAAGEMMYWDGSSWLAVAPAVNDSATFMFISGVPTWVGVVETPLPAIGDFRDGGIVFWVDDNGGGLVCAVSDQSSGIQWVDNYDYTTTGATGTTIGTGSSNTVLIINTQGTGSYAAQACNDLSLNGYSDWFLPSKDELNQMYVNKAAIDATATANGGSAFATSFYWSSSEMDLYYVWEQHFGDGYQNNYVYSKDYTLNVRAVRAF